MSLISINNHFPALRQIAALPVKRRRLTWEMAKRGISDRYAGLVFGVLRAMARPVILMAKYVFIPAIVLKVCEGRAWCHQGAVSCGRSAHPAAWAVFAALTMGTFALEAERSGSSRCVWAACYERR